MVNALLFSLVAGVVAFLVSSATIPLIKRIAMAVRAMDYPGGRREQADAIPRLGGIAVVLGVFIGGGTLTALCHGAYQGSFSITEFMTVILALFIIFICGVLEDSVGLSPVTRLLMQSIAALLVIRVGWTFGTINLPFVEDLELGILTGLISLIWIVGVTNAVNLLDGLDGLASGVVAIIASSLLIISLSQHDYLTAMIMGALAGSCLGFLRKNWAPAQIYLGDTGSLTLGFLLAIVSVKSAVKAPAAIAILVPILALGLPVIDTLLVMLFRFTRKSRRPLGRRFKRMFDADQNHLHHLMVRLGRNRSRIVIVIYTIAVVFCAMALLVSISKNMTLGLILIGFEILVVFSMRQLGMHADMLKISVEKRKSIRNTIYDDKVMNLKDIA
jgi:UDP-GlcNAc:undecaprenyl-phosphate GlcNAc-1-phosphate transferase